jgi:nicotinamidase-related amidase
VRGRPLVERLTPEADDYFVLKPKHSGFFSTTLDTLLAYLRARTLILTGLTADNCVLFTASDAYLRDFDVIVPPDCVASIDPRHTRQALDHMHRVLKAELTDSTALSLSTTAA